MTPDTFFSPSITYGAAPARAKGGDMAEKILRGRVLRFLSEPAGIDDTASYAYVEDGAILVEGGRFSRFPESGRSRSRLRT